MTGQTKTAPPREGHYSRNSVDCQQVEVRFPQIFNSELNGLNLQSKKGLRDIFTVITTGPGPFHHVEPQEIHKPSRSFNDREVQP